MGDLDRMYRMIADLEIAMMTTRRADGHLVSRAMSTQKRIPGADLWFVAAEGTDKLDEIANDPHVNLAYYSEKSREWISVSGLAHLSKDRDKIAQLYAPDWKFWFPDEGDPRHGTVDDPRFVLIGVDVHSAVYLEVNKPQAAIMFEVAKGWVTGEEPKLGEIHRIAA